MGSRTDPRERGKAEVLTDGVENPHFVRVGLGDVQHHLALGEDGAGPLGPQQHHGHVLQVWGTQGTRGEGMEAGQPPGSPSGSRPTCRRPYLHLAAVRAPRAGAVPVTVDQQHGPLSIRAPRPLGLEEKHQEGTGAPLPPPRAEESPTGSEKTPAPLPAGSTSQRQLPAGPARTVPRSYLPERLEAPSSLAWTRLRCLWKLSPSR